MNEFKEHTSANMPYFLEAITISKCYELPKDESFQEICNAISLIQYISLTCGNGICNSSTLHVEAKGILSSFLYLSQGNVVDTLEALIQTLEKLPDKCVTVSFINNKVHLNILNVDAFAVVLTISISNLLQRFMKKNMNGTILLKIIRCMLSNLNDLVTSPISIHLVNTLHSIIKDCADISAHRQLILNHIYLYLKGVQYKQAIKISDEVLGLVIKGMSGTEKLELFERVNKLVWWNRGDCMIITHLLNHWPVNLDVNVYLREMASRLASMLLENITNYPMKVVRVAVNHMNFETWNAGFVPSIADMISTHFDNNWELITKTFAQCVNLGVQRFQAQMYEKMESNILDTCYPALALHYSIHKGCLNVMDHKRAIVTLIHSPDYILQSCGVKPICVFNNKKSELTRWHIKHIKFYLENIFFSADEFYCKDLLFFLSHLNVQANRMLLIGSGFEQNLNDYTGFIQWLYDFIITGLLSRSLKGVKVGSELFNLVLATVCGSSRCLKIKYNLDETDHYDYRQSRFYKHLISKKAWNFESDITYNTITKEFLASEKVFPEIWTIIEKWDYSTTNSDLQITSETAFCIIEHKYGKEFVEKAQYCITLALSRENAGGKVVEVLEKWKNLSENFSHSSSVVDIESILTIYSFTSLISSLLAKGLIKNSEHPSILTVCKQIIKKLVKVSCEHPHATKSIEQTFVTIMSVLCVILKSSDAKAFSTCCKLVNEVMDQGSGKSVACSAAFAIHSMCLNAFESSDDAYEVLTDYFDSVLFSIYATPEVKMSKIRRNPEHRLIINAIVTAETQQNRVFLKRSMMFILDVLQNSFSGNSAKASALHTLEILISNSNIQNETFNYVSTVAIRTINEFSSHDWNVKNGAIQVLQALINRLLGQKNNLTQRRRHGMDDLVLLYPDLIVHCHKQMYSPITENNCDSVIAILALFSESFYSLHNLYNDQSISFIVESFQNAFINLIRRNAIVGVFAAKAFAALYPFPNISRVICDIVTWIKENFERTRKNVFATVISLLVAFVNKFNAFFVCTEGVNYAMLDLKMFLKLYNCKYEFSLFNILAVVTYDVLELRDRVVIVLSREETYETRLWLSTNLPYVLNNIDIEEYPSFLMRCFRFRLSITLLRHCIESVVDRYYELTQYSLINFVLTVFVDKFVSLETTNYIVVSFCETILLLLEGSHLFSSSIHKVLQLRRKCEQTPNIYFLTVYFALLSFCSEFFEEDESFSKKAVDIYVHEVAKRDNELQCYTASTLIFIYNCVNISNRPDILKIAFILLLTPESTIEVCKFVAFVFGQNLCDTYETLLNLLSVQNLLNCLKSKKDVATLLNRLKQFVDRLGDEFEDCGMFYMKQNDQICSYKKKLLNILEKQIEIVKMC
ncbi:hypothetical protein FQR65_LT13829 [Abscondita terminalis]|nr:hypothetical protein FQR65_LT13829 [Abscondita terminalis]